MTGTFSISRNFFLFCSFTYYEFNFCNIHLQHFPINFQSIKEKSEQEAKEKKFSFDVANKADNRRLNRYRDVNPYDHSRIVLHRGDVDYINANLVTVNSFLIFYYTVDYNRATCVSADGEGQ